MWKVVLGCWGGLVKVEQMCGGGMGGSWGRQRAGAARSRLLGQLCLAVGASTTGAVRSFPPNRFNLLSHRRHFRSIHRKEKMEK